MKRFLYAIATIVCVVAISLTATAVPVTYSDEATFRAAAGPTTTYGFETHGFAEMGAPPHTADLASPLSASDLDNNFDLAYTNLNAFQIWNSAVEPGVTEGTHDLFTHSVVAANYTLTFSNFGGSNTSITAFGLTITDFASNILDPLLVTTVTYDTGGLTGTLLSVTGPQPDFTQNFVGLTADPADAFTSITLTLNDNLSGVQYFDEVIYSQVTPIPEPSTLVLFGVGFLGLVGYVYRRKRRFSD